PLLILLSLTLVLVLGCPQDADSGSASVNIGPPLVFDEPESYTTEITNLPNPFKSWRGANVTAENWNLRREEIKEIVQYYEYGYLPSMEGVTKELTTWQQVGAPENNSWYGVITLTRGTVSGTISFSVRYPDGSTLTKPATGWPVIMGTGTASDTNPISATGNNAYYLERGIAVGNISVSQAGGSGQSGTFPSRTGTTVVTKLYGYNYAVAYLLPYPYGGNGYGVADPGDRNAPSSAMQQVWGFSRGIDGFELAKETPEGCQIDTNAIAQTGTSIGGKMALLYGAFDERVLLSMPVASGAAGAAIERFVSPTVNETQSKDRNMTGWMPNNMLNKAYQYLRIAPTEDGVQECWVVLKEEALINPNTGLDGAPTCVTTGGSAGDGEFQVWGNAGAVVYPKEGNNVKPGYGVLWYGWQVDEQKHESYQTITDYRTQYGGGMFNSRFREFINLYPTLNTTHIFNPTTAGVPFANGAHRSEIGYLTTQPFDQHYLSALVAPRGLYITVGCADSWTNPEGMFLNFLAAREVYRLLGKEKNVGYRLFVQQHTTATRQLHDMANALLELHKGNSLPANMVPDGTSAHPYTYTLADPRSKFDFLKLDWAAPGYESIASQVNRLIP
ncbi:MAG: hypothetical protein LBQ14_05005, partial [Treponema sp.]|nr:hypothetical protein [Treponema sp.]